MKQERFSGEKIVGILREIVVEMHMVAGNWQQASGMID
jgi:hypothetical protein